ncbi:MAG: hypothetical protein LBB80_01275 [Treponema sp.]|nr:hypothetical protein [Treponema sp.]
MVALTGLLCGSEDVRSYSSVHRVKSGMPVIILNVPLKQGMRNIPKGCNPEVKKNINTWAVDGAGIGATARERGVSTDRVIKALKIKRK